MARTQAESLTIAGVSLAPTDQPSAHEQADSPLPLATFLDLHPGARRSRIIGYTALAEHWDGHRFMPAAAEHLVRDSQGAPLHLGLSGTMARLTVPRSVQKEGLTPETNVWSFVHGDWGPGRIYMAAEGLRAQGANRPDIFSGMGGIYAIFARVRASSRYRDGEQPDWMLTDVQTTNDPFPYDTFVDDRASGGRHSEFMNGMLGNEVSRFVEKNGGRRAVNRMLDGVIQFGGELHARLSDIPNGKKGVSLENIMSEALRGSPEKVKDFVNAYITYNSPGGEKNPFSLRIFSRACHILEDAEKTADGKKGGRYYIHTLRDHVRREVLQAFLHAQAIVLINRELNARAASAGHAFITPFPFSVTIRDSYDAEFAQLLECIDTGDYTDAAQATAKKFGGDVAYHGHLSVFSHDKNAHPLMVTQTLKPNEQGQSVGQFSYEGNTYPVQHGGITARDIIRSLFVRTGAPLIDGVVARWQTPTVHRGSTAHEGTECLAVDLTKAPAKILRCIASAGGLTGGQRAYSERMLLSDIMAMPTPGDKYHIAVETCATGPMVRAVIHEGSGMQWVESGGTIVVLPATIVNAKQLTGQRLGRDERKTLRDSYAVANVATKKGPITGKVIAGAALHGGVLHMSASDRATVEVMPNRFMKNE